MKSPLWNIVFAAVVSAFVGCLGYLLSSISDIQKNEAARTALEFTSKDASLLQQKLTDVMTDIDLRISLIERDIQWIKKADWEPAPTPVSAPNPPSPPDPTSAPKPEEPILLPDGLGDSSPEPLDRPERQGPRYDLRRAVQR